MAITAGDLSILEEFSSAVSQAAYTGGSKTFAANKLYVLFVGSYDTSTNEIPVSIVTGSLTWTLVESYTTTNDQESCYISAPTSVVTDSTIVTFDSPQVACAWNIVELSNTDISGINGINAIVQSESVHELLDTFSHTLTNPVTTGNLVLNGIFAENIRRWTSGALQTALTTETLTRYSFVQYNLSELETVNATVNSATIKVGIVLEIKAGSVNPVLTLPTATAGGSDFLTGTVTTSGSPDGSLYWYVSTSATKPLEADLIAGTGSVSFNSQAVSTTGLLDIPIMPGLTAGQTYYVHYLHIDSVGSSNIETTLAVTTKNGTLTFTNIQGGASLTGISYVLISGYTPISMQIVGIGVGESTDINGDLVIDINAFNINDNDPITILYRDTDTEPVRGVTRVGVDYARAVVV